MMVSVSVFLRRFGVWIIFGVLVAGCGKRAETVKTPSDRRILQNLCWQTFELGVKDNNPFVQNHAMRLLGRIGNRRAVIALQSADLKDRPTLVRNYIRTLSKIQDSLALQSLVDYLRTSDFQIRGQVVIGISRMGHLYADSVMIRILRKAFREVDSIVIDSLMYDSLTTVTEKMELRARIGIALLKYKQTDGVPYIRQAVSDRSFQIRTAVIQTFGEVQPENSMEWLQTFRNDPSDYVRSKTVEALGKIASPAAYQLLRDFASNDRAEGVRLRAAIELMKINENEYTPWVLKGIRSREDDLRSLSILALGNVRNDSLKKWIVPQILPLMEDPGEWIRIAVIGALGKMGDTTSADRIAQALEGDPSQDVREIALSVLSRIRGHAMIPRLQKYLQDDSYSMRSAAVSALGRMQNGKTVGQVIIPAVYDRMVHDQDMIVRLWAAFVMYDILNDYRLTTADEKELTK